MSVCDCDDLQVTTEVEVVWSLMLRSRLSLRRSLFWIQTRPQPQSWSLTLRPWCPTLRPAPSQISPLKGEETISSGHFSLSLIISHVFTPPFSSCHQVFVFVLPACSDTWMRRLYSPDPPMLLSWQCWTTTTGWLDRQRTSLLSSWQNRKPLSRRPCPTLSWAESCLLSSTPRVTVSMSSHIKLMGILKPVGPNSEKKLQPPVTPVYPVDKNNNSAKFWIP